MVETFYIEGKYKEDILIQLDKKLDEKLPEYMDNKIVLISIIEK